MIRILGKIIFTLVFLLQLFPTAKATNPVVNNLGRRVVAHYTSQGDTLKLKAARFITENMAYHYSYQSDLLDKFYNRVKTISAEYNYPKSIEQYTSLYRELGNIGNGKSKVTDERSITEQSLIKNIDMAYDNWRNGHWAKHLSFEEFCEFLLPYRVGNERYEEDWRRKLREKFLGDTKQLDACDERYGSAYWAARYVCDAIKKYNFHVDDRALPHSDVDLPVSTLLEMGMGECSNYARLTTYIMRACGIPVCYDYTPQWPNKAHRHSWNALLDNSGRTLPFLGSETYPGQASRFGEKMAKVYRRTFAFQPHSAYALRKDTSEMLPPTLGTPFMLDVSDEYFKGANVSVDVKKSILKRQFVYLAVFDNAKWAPVDFAVIDSMGKATFNNIGREIVYLPVLWGRNGSVPCGEPILVAGDGSFKTLKPDKAHTTTLTIDRKYPVFGRMSDYAKSMSGGWFEASDSADFSNAQKVAEVNGIPSLWYNTLSVSTGGRKYRYWRYRAPKGSKGNVAEISFLSEGKELTISQPLCDDTSYNMGKAMKPFDKVKLSYYESKHQRNVWTGADMGKPVSVDEIRFMPRNDDNHVEKGHIYSLCYFEDGKEKTVATMTATTDALTFKNVPVGALYVLHDFTAGTEERIFTYENNRINWY